MQIIDVDFNSSSNEPENAAIFDLGRFVDLEAWVEEFNNAWEGEMRYFLEPGDREEEFHFFEFDPESNEFTSGLVKKVGEKVHAISEDVHDLVMSVFHRYTDEFGGVK